MPHFWGEVVVIATYLINQLPTQMLRLGLQFLFLYTVFLITIFLIVFQFKHLAALFLRMPHLLIEENQTQGQSSVYLWDILLLSRGISIFNCNLSQVSHVLIILFLLIIQIPQNLNTRRLTRLNQPGLNIYIEGLMLKVTNNSMTPISSHLNQEQNLKLSLQNHPSLHKHRILLYLLTNQ